MTFVNADPSGNLAQFRWPEFQGQGAAVAALANKIAEMRQEQTQNFQKTLAGSIKEEADRQAANAALEQAQAMGLPAPGGLAGMGTAGLTAYGGKKGLAELVQDQQDAAIRDRVNQSLIDWRGAGGGAGGAHRVSRVEDPDNPGQYLTPTQLYNRRKSQAALYGTQAKAIQQEGVDKPMAHGYVMKDGKMVYASTPEEKANPELVSPGDPLVAPEDTKAVYPPTFTPQYVKERTTAREDLLAKQKTIQDKMLNTAPDAGDQGGGTAGLRAQAQAAISSGKDPTAVAAKFKELTGEDL